MEVNDLNKPLTKLVVFWREEYKSGSNTFYSYDRGEDINNKCHTYGIEGLEKRLIKGQLRDKFKVAIIYDNFNNQEMYRYNEYGEIGE